MKRLKLFLFNTFILVFSSILLRVVGMFFNVYISNRVGQEALGVFGLIMSVYLFGITFACSGINIATTKVIAEEMAFGNETSIRKITQKCIFISLITGILASLILFLFADNITTYCLHDKVSHSVIYYICLALPFISLSAAINGYFTAVRKVYKNVFGKLFEQMIKIIATMYLCSLFLPSGLDYACYALVLGDVISEIVSCLFRYALYYFEKKKSYRSITSFSYTKRILRISIPVALTSYLRSGLSTLKQVLIPSSLEKSGLNCSTALSQYGIVTGMVMPLLTFPCVFIDSFSSLLVPEFSRYYVKKDFKRIRQVTKLIFFLTTLFSLFLTLLFALFSDELANFIYPNQQIGPYLKLLCPVLFFLYLDIVIDSILKGLDQQCNVMFVNVIDLMVSSFFIYYFVPILGFTGYVFSIFLSEILNFTLSSFKLCQVLKKDK